MNADLIALLLVLAAAPAITAFALWYGLTAPWYRSAAGRALFVSSTGLAMLIDISLLYKWLGDDYWLRDAVRLFVYAWIAAGAWLKLGALAHERRKARRARREPPI
jgi:hypothetical protein